MTKKFISHWLPIILYAIFIFTCSSVPDVGKQALFLNADKLCHFAEYAIFGFLLLRALDSSRQILSGFNLRIATVLFALAYALSDEFHQYFVPGRNMEFFDILSDVSGAFVGQLLFKIKYTNGKDISI